MKTFFSIIFILTSRLIIAQSDFQKGFIITNEFDTIHGLIDNGNYTNNAQYFDFINTKTDSVFRYYPNDILGYKFIDGKFYVTKVIEGKKVFMEYLINGKLDIYFLQDSEHNNHYFVAKDTLPLRELIHIDEIRNIDGTDIHFDIKRYRGLLNIYTDDCPKIKNDISNLNQLNHQNLIKLAKNYHNLSCENENCIIYEKEIRRKIKFFFSGGPNVFIPNNVIEYDQERVASINIQSLFQLIQRNERLYFGIGLNYLGTLEKSESIRIPISFNYLYPRKGFSPYFGYELDLKYLVASQSLKIGYKYQMNEYSLLLIAGVNTGLLVLPYSLFINIGFVHNIK